MTKDRRNWWLYGFFGAFFLGMGISVSIEAGFWKHDGSHWSWWIFGGIFGLSCAVFGAFCMVKAGGLFERMRLKKLENKK